MSEIGGRGSLSQAVLALTLLLSFLIEPIVAPFDGLGVGPLVC